MRALLISVVCLFGLMGFKTGELGKVSIRYGFESIEIDSGPDTFELFESRSSEVSLSSQYAFRGSYSLHIQDKIGNLSFPEFQGYFPIVRGGKIDIGFALMTPSPNEPFNVAFAGEQHFTMTKDGLGFWLFNDAGTLRHMSDGIPKRLFDLVPYQWYWFEIELDISKGEYSLVVRDELDLEIVKLDQQKNPTNAKKSSLQKYSFAGDLEDQGNGNLYIDEFVLRTDFADSPKRMIAPGRRSLFVDKWDEYHKKIVNLDFCLPPKLPYDFIDVYNTEGLKILQSNVDALQVLLSSPTQQTLSKFEHEDELILGVSKWAQGCLSLKNGNYTKAVELLQSAESAIGNSPATQLGLAMAYAKIDQTYAAKSIISSGQLTWPEDVRWLVLLAAIGFESDRPEDSEAALSGVANALDYNKREAQALMEDVGWLRNPAATKLRSKLVWDDSAEDFIASEQYYFALLWQSRYREAEGFADDFNRLLRRHNLTSPLWLERSGDAALFGQRFPAAERNYKKVLEQQSYSMSTLQKLADVYFLQGRVDDERDVRESIFGVLNYE